jgi:hypothetical protein
MRKLFIMLVAAGLVLSFTLPAFAKVVEVKASGNIQFYTGFRTTSKEVNNDGYGGWDGDQPGALGGTLGDYPNPTGFHDDTDIFWRANQSSTRMRIDMKSDNPGVDFRLEIRYRRSSIYRHWRVRWEFTDGWRLYAGQYWGPDWNTISECSAEWATMDGVEGSGGSFRVQQIGIMGKGWTFAFLTPVDQDSSGGDAYGIDYLPGQNDTDYSLPKIVVKYEAEIGAHIIPIFAGYQSYEAVEETATSERSVDITSYLIGASPEFNFGPLQVRLAAYYVQNPLEYDLYEDKCRFFAHVGSNFEVNDATGYSLGFNIGYTISPQFTIYGGYGFDEYEISDLPLTTESEHSAYYVSLKYHPQPYITIAFDYAAVDWGDFVVEGVDQGDQGDTTYAGVYWIINF